jgi:cytochrome c oxidase subunit IV
MSDAHVTTADAPEPAPGHAHDLAHDDHHADLDKHIRAAYVVFGALLLLTGVTVGVSYFHLPTGPAIALALAIALLKGSLVLGWFMHLISEKKLIFAVLAVTVVFFLVLLLMPYWTASDVPHIGPPGDPRGPSEH